MSLSQMAGRIQQQFEEVSRDGFRVLGVAMRDVGAQATITRDHEADMTFLGFLVLSDPPKPGIIDTINELKQLGTSLKVITGDNHLVAANVGQQVEFPHPRMLTGPDLHQLSDGALLKQVNDTDVFAVSVTHKRGTFWGLQYHPEYDVHEMARLIVAREDRLIRQGFFAGHEDLEQYVNKLEALHAQPDSKFLRWQLGIDETILETSVRQREFINWIDKLVLPHAGSPPRT